MRDDVFRFKIAANERRMIEELAEKDGLSASAMLRLLVRRAYTKTFGDKLTQRAAPKRGKR